MPNRSKDWLAQAKRDLNHAVNARKDNDFEWSCFSAEAIENARQIIEFCEGCVR